MKETKAALQALDVVDREIDKREAARAVLVERLDAQAARLGDAARELGEQRRNLAGLEERGAPAEETTATRDAILAAEQVETRLRQAYAEEERAARLMTNAFEREVSQLRGRRAAACERVPADLIKRYEALLSVGRRPAVATVTRGCCSGCHVALPTRFEQALQSHGSLQSCPRCKRILLD